MAERRYAKNMGLDAHVNLMTRKAKEILKEIKQ